MKLFAQNHIDRSKIDRILVRATNWVGDMVISLPALEAVRENFPKSTLAVLARPWVIPLIKDHPAVDQVLPLRKGRGYLTDIIEIIRVAGLIRRIKFDLAILFQNAFEAALLAYLGGVRFRIGYDTDSRGFLLSHPIKRNHKILKLHQVEYYLCILRAMGWKAKTRDPCLFIGDKDKENIGSILLSKGIEQDDLLLGLGPGAIYGPAKRWPPERFATIGDWATERWGAKVMVLGSQAEQDICRSLSQSMKHNPLNFCGNTTLGEAMALVKRCDFFVTNDSGLMHVASALDRPMVAIFGSTDPHATGPRSQKARIVKHDIECAPCLKPKCSRDYRCMLGIEPAEVWKEMEILKERFA